MRYSKHVSGKQTPQSQPIPGSSQIKNNAGGYAWRVGDWERLDRFLILGSEGGTYYVKERDLTVQNAEVVLRCISSDPARVAERIATISESRRAPKQGPALFALALLSTTHPAHARLVARRVLRTFTHLASFLNEARAQRGWGRGLRKIVADFYTRGELDAIALQVCKYRNREGWTHRDMLRVGHPKPANALAANLLAAIAGKPSQAELLPSIMASAFDLQNAKTEEGAARMLREDRRLTWEMVPGELVGSPKVWEALAPHMPMGALVRNLARMTASGLIAPLSKAEGVIAGRIGSDEVSKARLHPVAVLAALLTYKAGKGARGKLTWAPSARIIDALDAAFYTAMGSVQPVGKALVLGVDVSSSMDGGELAGVPGLSPCVAAAALSLVTARVESQHVIMAFATQPTQLKISPRSRLDDVIDTMRRIGFGGTDCSLPMRWAGAAGIKADGFAIYTDSETWAGSMHPAQALRAYRASHVADARLVVVGMTATDITIADPNDQGMLDVVGFDTATPNLIADFLRGEQLASAAEADE